MKRTVTIAGAAVLLCAGLTQAQGPRGSMPDIARQYYERQNCHQAYDLLIELLDTGGASAVSAADIAWAQSYEDNANGGVACPEPSGDLAKRASNRTVATTEGLSKLAAYHDQDDGAAYYEAAYSVLTGATNIVGPEVGFQMLGKAAELGDPSAEFFLGALHVSGTFGTPSDYASAFPYLEQAAQAGHVDALFLVANMYKEGLGTKKDARKAFDFYRQAAERGHVYAAYLAAYMANDGDGVRTDHELAYRLARNLAAQDEVVGAVIAASALLQMDDAKEHEDEVLYWMDLGIRDGDDTIRSQLSEMRPRVVAAFERANAPPEYQPRVWKACPMKTVCMVDRFTGAQISCTTNKDYWSDCDG